MASQHTSCHFWILSPLARNSEHYFWPLLHIHCHYQLWFFGSSYPHLITVQWSPHLLWQLLYGIQEQFLITEFLTGFLCCIYCFISPGPNDKMFVQHSVLAALFKCWSVAALYLFSHPAGSGVLFIPVFCHIVPLHFCCASSLYSLISLYIAHDSMITLHHFLGLYFNMY